MTGKAAYKKELARQWDEAFGSSTKKNLTCFYVLHYGDGEREKDGFVPMNNMVSKYYGEHYTEAVRLHNNHYGYRGNMYSVCYVTTSKEKAESWENDTLDTSRIKTLVI